MTLTPGPLPAYLLNGLTGINSAGIRSRPQLQASNKTRTRALAEERAMSFQVLNLKEQIGSEIRADVETLLKPAVAAELRQLLQQRGVLVFKQLNLADEQQVRLAGLLGHLRNEGEKGIFKI